MTAGTHTYAGSFSAGEFPNTIESAQNNASKPVSFCCETPRCRSRRRNLKGQPLRQSNPWSSEPNAAAGAAMAHGFKDEFRTKAMSLRTSRPPAE